jgi:hypothetical protein
MPSPKWKLVVEIGAPPKTAGVEQDGSENCQQSNELLSLMCTHMPKDKTDTLAPYLPGFTSLHLLLMKRSRSVRENEMLKTALASFVNYKISGQSDSNIAWMTARDCMLLSIQDAEHFSTAPTNFAPKNNVSTAAASFQQQQLQLQQQQLQQPLQQQQLQQPLAQLLHHVSSSGLASGYDCNSVAPSTTPNHAHTSQSNVQLSQSLQGIGHPQNPTLQPSIGNPGMHTATTNQNDARYFPSLGTEGFSDQLDMSFLSGANMRLSGNHLENTTLSRETTADSLLQSSLSQHDGSINEFEAYYHP